MIDLATALVKAQSEIPPVHKNATAKVKTKTGADYSYTYVTLDALLAVVLPALNKNGIALIQAPTLSDMGPLVLKTVLAHGPSGETFVAQAPLKASGTPQDLGSEISYARRYAIMSLLGIAADEDDDGAAASKPRAPQKRSAGGKGNQAAPSPAASSTGMDSGSPAGLVDHLSQIDEVVTALAEAKSNEKSDWIKSIDEQHGDTWRTDLDAASVVLAKVRRWANQANVKIAA